MSFTYICLHIPTNLELQKATKGDLKGRDSLLQDTHSCNQNSNTRTVGRIWGQYLVDSMVYSMQLQLLVNICPHYIYIKWCYFSISCLSNQYYPLTSGQFYKHQRLHLHSPNIYLCIVVCKWASTLGYGGRDQQAQRNFESIPRQRDF